MNYRIRVVVRKTILGIGFLIGVPTALFILILGPMSVAQEVKISDFVGLAFGIFTLGHVPLTDKSRRLCLRTFWLDRIRYVPLSGVEPACVDPQSCAV